MLAVVLNIYLSSAFGGMVRRPNGRVICTGSTLGTMKPKMGGGSKAVYWVLNMKGRSNIGRVLSTSVIAGAIFSLSSGILRMGMKIVGVFWIPTRLLYICDSVGGMISR